MATQNSTTGGKARKPRGDFPLFPHATGKWAMKIRGEFHYFGEVADDPSEEAALQRWLDVKDGLLAGRTPRCPPANWLLVPAHMVG